jgi:hypothetical protein
LDVEMAENSTSTGPEQAVRTDRFESKTDAN